MTTSTGRPNTSTFIAEVELICPFCEGHVAAGSDVPPPNGERVPAVVHSLPMCETFKKYEPDEFLSLARQKIQGSVV